MASSSTSISFADGNRGPQVGINNGSIHFSPERPETPPNPLSTVPFFRDPDFVSRDTLLDQIHEKISISGSRIALVGVGGVGESQLCIEYSYRIRCESPETWVFWVHASNAARFEQSFRDIADQAKIPGRQNPTRNIFQLVESWLKDSKRGKWLLILDNVDDDEFLRKPLETVRGQVDGYTKPLLEFLPRSPNGSIIITSRSQEVALRIVDHQDVLKVDPMTESEALELLQRKLGQPLDIPDDSVLRLVEELEFMPLAIIQAASYIVHRAPRCSVSQYLEIIRKNDRGAVKLLSYEAGHSYRDWQAKNSILVTWQISFDHIRRSRPSAADLLSLMSFFDRQGISEDLLQPQVETIDNDSSSDTTSSQPEVDQTFEDDITTLRDFSFISLSNDGKVFTMHRLVQLTLHIWLEANGQLERWKEQFITILWQRFPEANYENWEMCQSLLPHVKSAMSQRPKSLEPTQRKWAALLYACGCYLFQVSHYAESSAMASKSRNQWLDLLGPEDAETIQSTSLLAATYRAKRQWKEAEELHMQVMIMLKSQNHEFGNNDAFLEAATSDMYNLAATYIMQARLEDAKDIQLQVMEICNLKTDLGAKHAEMAIKCVCQLALTLRMQDRLEDAKILLEQATEMIKSTFEEDHPSRLKINENLALTYKGLQQWGEAANFQVQVLKSYKTRLGEDHFDTVSCMGNLAMSYHGQGRLEEAENLQVQVLKSYKARLGEDHPDTVNCMGNLAVIYCSQGRWEEAENFQEQVLKYYKTRFGEDHLDTVDCMGKLAMAYRSQGRWKEAENLQVQILKSRKARLGEEHSYTVDCMRSLAIIYYAQCRWEEAEKLQMQILNSLKARHGEEHPDTVDCMEDLAMVYYSQWRWEEAVKLQTQAIEIGRRISETIIPRC